MKSRLPIHLPEFVTSSGLRRSVAALSAALALAACEQKHFQPPDKTVQRREARALFTRRLFDTITWASDSARTFEGNEIYAEKCRRCHGTVGEGTTEYARDHGLDVPSLVQPHWAYESTDSLREMVFAGHSGGMPIYGVAGITPREIDAVAYYVLYTLRPDVLGPSAVPAKGGKSGGK
jgi:mono/diheme cytochrome c family protein